MKIESASTMFRMMRQFFAPVFLLLLVANVQASVSGSTGKADLALKGNQDGTVFRSLTVEGENRVQIRFERPELGLDIDPSQAAGLVLDDALDILNRTLPDLVTPFMQVAVQTTSPYSPRSWLTAYTDGPVARFTPVLDGVASWELMVADSRGQTAMIFAGQGNPPPTICWDGTRLDGTPAAPGYTYSYVLEARDSAGNQRRFVGDGFPLPAYRRDHIAGPEFLVSGAQLQQAHNLRSGPSELVLEAASWFNLRCEPTQPIRIVATHRSVAEATGLAEMVSATLTPLLVGSRERIVIETRVETGAPVDGTLCLTARPIPGPLDQGL